MRLSTTPFIVLLAFVTAPGAVDVPIGPRATFTATGAGEVERAQAQRRPRLRTRTDLVTVAVSVVDSDGRLVTGLGQDDFSVFEDGVEMPITQFVGERVPVSLGLVLDISESMTGQRMADARLAVDQFLNDLLRADDEAFIMVFNHRPRLLKPWTEQPSALAGALDEVTPTGGTAVYDAVVESLKPFAQRSHQRAAIVIVSDGADTASDHSIADIRPLVRRADAFIYAIAIDAPSRRPVSGRPDPYALREITDASGGYTEVVHASADLAPATARIADELNRQYLLGYAPPRGADGKYHSIRVRTRDTSFRVRARRGYVAEPYADGR
jgi:Ca-activated chloride channel family protein